MATLPTLASGVLLAARLLRLTRHRLRTVATSILLQAGIQLLALPVPLLTKQLFDRAWPARDVTYAHLLVAGIAAFSAGIAFLSALRSYVGQVLATRLSGEIALAFFDRLQRTDTRILDGRQSGETVSRYGDLQKALAAVLGMIQTLLLSVTMLVTAPALLFWLNWRLAVLAVVVVPVSALLTYLMGRIGRRLAQASAEAGANLSAARYESALTFRTVRVVSAEAWMLDRARDATEAAQRAALRLAALNSLRSFLVAAIAAAGTALFSWVGWTMVVREELSLGAFMAFTAYLGLMAGPFGQLLGLVDSMQEAAVALSRFFEYYDAPVDSDADTPTGMAELHSRAANTIVLENVSFGYRTGAWVLRAQSMRVPAGALAALVGPSGAGKSTILRLVARLYAPQSGRVVVGGLDLAHDALHYARRSMGIVLQEGGMVAGSVRDNILMGRNHLSEVAIEQALEATDLIDLVQSLPAGLDTQVSEAGMSLSGGQRQRLAIARAIAGGPPILVFDEATSGLDPHTEHVVLTRIRGAYPLTTMLIATHRETIAHLADQVYWVGGAQIRGGQSHSVMIETDSAYREFWGYGAPQERSLASLARQ